MSTDKYGKLIGLTRAGLDTNNDNLAKLGLKVNKCLEVDDETKLQFVLGVGSIIGGSFLKENVRKNIREIREGLHQGIKGRLSILCLNLRARGT